MNAKLALIGLALVGLVAASVGFIINPRAVASKAGGCAAYNDSVTRAVKIQDNRMQPEHTKGQLCDRLTITNLDPIERLVAFGPHEHHVAYDGITERLLGQGQSLTITLNQVGDFNFHDHLHDEVAGSFSVSRR